MSIAVVRFPKADVNGNTSTVSKWNAVHHALEYHLQRMDAEVQSCTYNASTGRLRVQLYGAVSGGVGDTVYISSGVHTGTGQIDAIIYSGTPVSIIDLIWWSTNTSTQIGGFINWNSARKNYHTKTNILIADSAGALIVVGQSINKPDASGFIRVDCRTFLKTQVGYKDSFAYDVRNWADIDLGGPFTITYSENWTGFAGGFSKPSDTLVYYYVNSTKQIQQRYGSNVGEHVPFSNYAESDTRAKFLSDFATPTYFPGYPFSIGFIYSESLAGNEVTKVERTIDKNKLEVNEDSYDIDYLQAQFVNRLMLEEDYDPEVAFVDIWLQIGAEASASKMMADDYVADDYTEETTGMRSYIITDEIYQDPE